MDLDSRAKLDTLLGHAEDVVGITIVAHRQHRRDRWHGWCNDPTHTARVYRYIRQGPTLVVFPPVCSAATQPGRATMLSEVDECWWGLWSPPVQETNPNPWLPALDQLPAFPQVGRLMGALLKDIIKATPLHQGPRSRWLAVP